MAHPHAPLFRGRHFPDDIIILTLRWYLRYSLSYRDLKELLAERGVAVDHTTLWRWVARAAHGTAATSFAGIRVRHSL